MTPSVTHRLCDRARSWAALAPDGELSELEGKLLRVHLASCGACSSFSAEVAAFAIELRAAAFEPLPRPVQIATWRRRRVLARLRTVGAAAAVAVMALGIASRAPLSNGDRGSVELSRVAGFADDRAEQQLLRTLRRDALTVVDELGDRPARHFGTQPA